MTDLRHLTLSKKCNVLFLSLVGISFFMVSTNAYLLFSEELKMSFTTVLNELSVFDNLIYPCSCSIFDFAKWHGIQSTCKLFLSFVPPSPSGIIWSISNFCLGLIAFLHDAQLDSESSNMRFLSSLLG